VSVKTRGGEGLASGFLNDGVQNPYFSWGKKKELARAPKIGSQEVAFKARHQLINFKAHRKEATKVGKSILNRGERSRPKPATTNRGAFGPGLGSLAKTKTQGHPVSATREKGRRGANVKRGVSCAKTKGRNERKNERRRWGRKRAREGLSKNSVRRSEKGQMGVAKKERGGIETINLLVWEGVQMKDSTWRLIKERDWTSKIAEKRSGGDFPRAQEACGVSGRREGEYGPVQSGRKREEWTEFSSLGGGSDATKQLL